MSHVLLLGRRSPLTMINSVMTVIVTILRKSYTYKTELHECGTWRPYTRQMVMGG